MIKKNLKWILFFTAVLTAILITLFSCAVTEPQVKAAAFPFSITYTLDGESFTIEDTLSCRFDATVGGLFSEMRYWIGSTSQGHQHYCVREDGEYRIILLAGMDPQYYMSDPLFDPADPYWETTYDRPYAYACNNRTGEEITDPQKLKELGFTLVSYQYPEPIPNRYRFAGFDFNGGTSLLLAGFSAVLTVVLLFMVRKEKEHTYGRMDYVSFVFNLLIGLFLLPVSLFLSLLHGIDGINSTPVDAFLVFLTPAVTIAGIGLSIALRRRKKSLAGLLVQFAGPLLFLAVLVIDFFVNVLPYLF